MKQNHARTRWVLEEKKKLLMVEKKNKIYQQTTRDYILFHLTRSLINWANLYCT